MTTISEIKQICQKKTYTKITKHYRATSYYFTWLFLYFKLTANQVSALGMLFGVLSTLFFITNNYYLFILGSFLFYVAMVADYSDGEVGRFRKYKKLPDELYRSHGGFFDSLNHISPPLLFFVMSLSFIHTYNPLLILGVGFINALFRLLLAGFYDWTNSALKLLNVHVMDNRRKHDRSSVEKKFRYIYSSLFLPFTIAIFSIIGIVFNINAVFYLWIFYAIWGVLLFTLDIFNGR